MGLRIATIEDKVLVLNMVLKFVDATNYRTYADIEVLEALVEDFLTSDNDNKIVLVYDDIGFIAGMSDRFIYGTGLAATELAWWVEPSVRGNKAGKELLTAFEYWADKLGCKFITMSCLDDKVANIYEKKGYVLFERAYVKTL